MARRKNEIRQRTKRKPRTKHEIRRRKKAAPITIEANFPLRSAWGQGGSVEVKKSAEAIQEEFAGAIKDPKKEAEVPDGLCTLSRSRPQHGKQIFHPPLEKAGLCRKQENGKTERIRFHDLRHTYASLLIEQGENIKYIQTQLGHSSPTVTLNVYAHLMKPTNQDSAQRLESSIFEATGSKMVANNEKGAAK